MFPYEPEEQKKIKEAHSLEKLKAEAKLHHEIAEHKKVEFEGKDKNAKWDRENLFCSRSPTTPRAL